MNETVLTALIGTWQGNCRTWFEPGQLADESEIAGRFEPILGGLFVRHTYQGEIKGRQRCGEETLAFNPVTKLFQSSWVDDFHMSSGIMFSEGAMIYAVRHRNGFSDVAARQNNWKAVRVYNQPWKLFHIEKDLGENNDLASEHPEIVGTLVGEAKQWSETHTQPLWYDASQVQTRWK